MSTKMRQNALLVALWFIVSIAFAALVQISVQSTFRPPEKSIDLNTIRFSSDDAPFGDAASLPLRKHLEKDALQSTNRVSMSFSLETTPDDGLFLFVPRFQESLSIELNGELIFQSSDFGNWKGPVGTTFAYVWLPTKNLKTGVNELCLSLSSLTSGVLTLSEVYVAPRDTLYPHYARLAAVQNIFLPILYGAQVFLALSSLIAFLLRRGDVLYAWLAGLMFYACGVSSGVLADAWSYASQLSVWFIVMGPISGILLIGFSMSFAELPRPTSLKYAFAILPLPILAVLLSGSGSFRDVAMVFSVPTTLVLFMISAGIIAFGIVKKPSFESMIFLCGLCLMVFAVMRDFSNGFGHYFDGIMLSQLSRLLAFIGVAIFLVRRQASTAIALDNAADDLRRKLNEKEAELLAKNEREQQLLKQQAIGEERRRLTADLHDGVAGHLATIVALADRKHDEDEYTSAELVDDMRSSARNALGDLRLVLDALSVEEPDLRLALASFRDRCIDPIERMGIEVDWSIIKLPDTYGMTRADILHVLRVMQEALTNAVRHGEPEKIRIHAMPAGPNSVEICIENSGGRRMDNPNTPSGRGLQNMRTRARALKGNLGIFVRPDGAEIRLTFPVSMESET